MANVTTACASVSARSLRTEWAKYCSEYCKESGDHTELRQCRHPECKKSEK
jgi:hypothetical protein